MLQRIGGALLTPGSLAILQASFAPADRARAIGAWSGLGGVAIAAGPLIGGYLISAASWRWIFFINVPIAAVVVALGARHVPESRDPSATGRIDYAGALAAAAFLSGITFALIEAPALGWASPAVVTMALLGAAGLVSFLAREHRAARLPTPLARLANRPHGRYRLSCRVQFPYRGGDVAAQAATGGVRYDISLDPARRRWYLDASWKTPVTEPITLAQARHATSSPWT